MPRYKAIVEYIGTEFVGWQRQANGLSVQQAIEEAILALTKQVNITVQGAGRTDAGVHALGQVMHFDLTTAYQTFTLLNSLNHFLLPYSISILSIERCSEEFHARFHAKKRHYIYRIINRKAKLTLDEKRAWWIRQPLNLALMNQAALYLLGQHDFTSFRAKNCQAASATRTLEHITLVKVNEQEIQLQVAARSFLHHMVRNITGTLALVGLGRIQPADLQQILIARDRSKAGATAPAYGLYFAKAEY